MLDWRRRCSCSVGSWRKLHATGKQTVQGASSTGVQKYRNKYGARSGDGHDDRAEVAVIEGQVQSGIDHHQAFLLCS